MLRDWAVLLVVLVLLVAGFGLADPGFLDVATLRVIVGQVAPALLLAAGITLVLLTGGIDLSVGSVLGLCGAVLGHAMVFWQWPLAAAMPLAVAAGGACGAASGVVTVAFRVPSFVVTLAMLEMARALTFLLTDSRTLYIGARVEALTTAIGGLSLAFVVALAVVAAGELTIRRTVFGRRILAVGDSPRAVWAAGVDPRPVQAAVFGISGALAGLAAVFHTSRLASADPNAGTGFELQAIAAAVVGGTSLLGARGSVVGAALGVLVIATLGTGLAQVGASDATKRLVTGAVILGAVIVDASRQGGVAMFLARLRHRS
jgi:ribose transport system permease protein